MASETSLRVRWHKPIGIERGVRTPDHVMIGSIADASATWLRDWILTQEWPEGTVFELIRTRGNRSVEVRCHLSHVRAWRPRRDHLPLGSDLPLPQPRMVKVMIFKNMLSQALEYAVDKALISEKNAAALVNNIMSHVDR